MLRMNGMTMDDVQIVEFPYADDWYNNPTCWIPMENPSELWLKRDHKHDLAFRPLETALEKGLVDAHLYAEQSLQLSRRRQPAISRRLRTCPGIRIGRCRWPISRPLSRAAM